MLRNLLCVISSSRASVERCCVVLASTVREIRLRLSCDLESLLATSTPDSEATGSTYQQRKRKQTQQFLTGTSRAAYRLDPLLEESLAMSEISQGTETDSEEDEAFRARIKRRGECKRGCPAVLKTVGQSI